jgi:hypothetical protein
MSNADFVFVGRDIRKERRVPSDGERRISGAVTARVLPPMWWFIENTLFRLAPSAGLLHFWSSASFVQPRRSGLSIEVPVDRGSCMPDAWMIVDCILAKDPCRRYDIFCCL